LRVHPREGGNARSTVFRAPGTDHARRFAASTSRRREVRSQRAATGRHSRLVPRSEAACVATSPRRSPRAPPRAPAPSSAPYRPREIREERRRTDETSYERSRATRKRPRRLDRAPERPDPLGAIVVRVRPRNCRATRAAHRPAARRALGGAFLERIDLRVEFPSAIPGIGRGGLGSGGAALRRTRTPKPVRRCRESTNPASAFAGETTSATIGEPHANPSVQRRAPRKQGGPHWKRVAITARRHVWNVATVRLRPRVTPR